MRGPRPLGLRVGEDVELAASVADLRLFDPASGHRLVWVPDHDEDRARPAAVASDVR